jgi:hypothetical protein
MKNKKITHQVLVGNVAYEIFVDAYEEKGQTFIEADNLSVQLKKLAHDLILKHESYNCDVFNFVMNTVGEKAADIAHYLETTPANLSQLRRGKECSKTFWKFFRITMLSRLSEKRNREIDQVICGELGSKVA